MIRFPCKCGRLLQAREEDVGKMARCPACQTVMPVPAEEPFTRPTGSATQEVDPPSASGRSRARLPQEEDYPEDDFDRRRRRRSDSGGGGSKILLAMAIVGIILVVVLCGGGLAAYLFVSAGPVRTAAVRTQDANQLKQIGLGFHNLMMAQGVDRLPQAAAIRSADGKPLLSWRVAILPFLEEHSLYHQFHHDEPWDSPHNLKLLPKMPSYYKLPIAAELPEGMTYYQVVVGPGTLFEETKEVPGALNPKRPMAFKFAMGLRFPLDIPDGSANTILVATARNPVPWTKPDDLVYNPRDPVSPLLGGHMAKGYNLLMADGSVHWVPQETPLETIRALITRNGGEVVSLP